MCGVLPATDTVYTCNCSTRSLTESGSSFGRISTVSQQFHAYNEISSIKNQAPNCPSFHSELTYFSRCLQSRSSRYAQTTNGKRLQLIDGSLCFYMDPYLRESGFLSSKLQLPFSCSFGPTLWRKYELAKRTFSTPFPGIEPRSPNQCTDVGQHGCFYYGNRVHLPSLCCRGL